jgi:hypothetical protein
VSKPKPDIEHRLPSQPVWEKWTGFLYGKILVGLSQSAILCKTQWVSTVWVPI